MVKGGEAANEKEGDGLGPREKTQSRQQRNNGRE